MNITNDEKTLITKEERTWPPEHCEVYLVDENNHGIIFVREEKTITIKEHDKEQKIPIDNIIGQYWIPTYEKRIPGKWYITNVDVVLPRKIFGCTENIVMKNIQQKNSWLFMMNV